MAPEAPNSPGIEPGAAEAASLPPGTASAELVALVAAEIRRIAHAQGRDRGAAPDADEPLANLLARVLSDCALAPLDRPPFLTIYARAVRQIVCDYLSRHGTDDLDPEVLEGAPTPDAVLSLDAVLLPLERVNARLVSVVDCLFFARLTEDETAASFGSDRAGVQREWTRARAWVLKELAVQDGAVPRSDVSVANAVWVDAVLRSAIALPVNDRDGFLAQCHAAAPGLRQDVEELLRLSDHDVPWPSPGDLPPVFLWSVLAAAGALSPPVPHAAANKPGTETPNDSAEALPPLPASTEQASSPDAPLRIGEWRIVGEQEERGAGRLLLVSPPGREETAIARVLPGSSSPSGIELFNHECRRLEAITDPVIARLMDYGITGDGQFYLVHAPAEGRPLLRYCARHGLGEEQRVRLLVQVCASVQAAHRLLVTHGALGPSTVLADDEGKITIVDFGVEPLLSAVAAAGAERPVPSISSDITQAGLLLRALVSRASGLAEPVDADLTVIASCAVGDGSREWYASIEALRSDLQRWLDRRPVLARGGDRAYRAGRFMARRRVPVAIAAAVALVGFAFIPAGVAEWRRNMQDSDRAAAIDRVLAGMFDGSRDRPTTPDAQGARTYVDRAATLVRTGLDTDAGRRSGMLLTIGRAYLELGAFQSSIGAFEDALGLARQRHGEDSLEVADILEPLGRAHHALGRYDESESSLRTARAIRLLREGAAHPSTRSVNVELASILHGIGRTGEAEQILRTELDPSRSADGARTASDQLVTRSRVALAGVLRDRGLWAEAERLYREVLEVSPQRASAGRARAQVGLAGLLIARGETEEPTTLLLGGIQALRQLHGQDHPILLDALRTQARLRLAQSRLEEALAAITEAQRIHQQSVVAFTLDVPTTRGLQAELALKEGRTADAVATSRLALDEFERLSLGDHPLTLEVRAVLGEALTARGRRDEAVPVLGRAVATAEGLVPAGDPRIIRLRTAVADATSSRGPR